jgi:hypothetical protein
MQRAGNSGHLARFSRDVGYHKPQSKLSILKEPSRKTSQPTPLDGCPTFAKPAPACRGAYVGRKRQGEALTTALHLPVSAAHSYPAANARNRT